MSVDAPLPLTQRALVLHAANEVRVETLPLTPPAPGALLLEVEAALIGGTVRKVARRGAHTRLGTPPYRIGHEGVGRVVAVGDGVTRFKVNDRVLPANSAACGTCAFCMRGLSAQCTSMTWLRGFLGTHVEVPEAIVRGNTWRVPADREPAPLALAENLACVLKGHDRTPARAGESVAVLGRGPIGLLWVWVLARAGAAVTSLARTDEGAALAQRLGASATATIKAFDRDSGPTLVVEAVGTLEAWQRALDLVAPGGRVHMFGGPPPGSELALSTDRVHYDEIQVSGSFHHTPFHFAEAVRILLEGQLDTAPLLGATTDLEGAVSHIGQASGGKVVVQP